MKKVFISQPMRGKGDQEIYKLERLEKRVSRDSVNRVSER